MKRLSIADVKASEVLSAEEKKNIVGGTINQIAIADDNCTIKCTCNGKDYGNVCSIQECWNKC